MMKKLYQTFLFTFIFMGVSLLSVDGVFAAEPRADGLACSGDSDCASGRCRGFDGTKKCEATGCGAHGQPPCTNSFPDCDVVNRCYYDVDGGVCSDVPTYCCGRLTQVMCPPALGDPCDADYVPRIGFCDYNDCGYDGAKCCANNPMCDLGYMCDGGTCVPDPDFAQGNTDPPALAEPNLLGDILNNIFKVVRGIAILIGIWLVATNGYKLMFSQGDPRKVEDGKDGLTSAIIGLVFVLLALWVINFIMNNFTS